MRFISTKKAGKYHWFQNRDLRRLSPIIFAKHDMTDIFPGVKYSFYSQKPIFWGESWPVIDYQEDWISHSNWRVTDIPKHFESILHSMGGCQIEFHLLNLRFFWWEKSWSLSSPKWEKESPSHIQHINWWSFLFVRKSPFLYVHAFAN